MKSSVQYVLCFREFHTSSGLIQKSSRSTDDDAIDESIFIVILFQSVHNMSILCVNCAFLFTFLTLFSILSLFDNVFLYLQDSSKTGPIYSMGPASQWGHIFFKCCPDGSGFHPRFDERPNGNSAFSLSVSSFFTQGDEDYVIFFLRFILYILSLFPATYGGFLGLGFSVGFFGLGFSVVVVRVPPSDDDP